MNKLLVTALLCILLSACNNDKKKAPDVSDIPMDIKMQRFDHDFFAIDTNDLENSLKALHDKYGELVPLYLDNIIAVADPVSIRTFLRLYRPVYDTARIVFDDFTPIRKQVEQAFRYVKYYYPEYELPAAIIPILGPMNSIQDMARMANGDYTPNFLRPGYAGISLQFYLGSEYSLYKNEYFVNNVAPRYRSRRFSKEYIIADLMKLLTEDIVSDNSNGKPLIEQFIEKGKQWWLQDKFLPSVHDTIKTGYTSEQLDWCTENEGLIWSFIIKNEDLNSVNPVTLQTYIGEAPFTQGFSPEYSPGNIGQWIGWQIVKKYEERNPQLTPKQVMQAASKQILEEAKYKPK